MSIGGANQTKAKFTNAFMGAWVEIKMDKINSDRREKRRKVKIKKIKI